jgi:hypothetical protein
VALPACGNPGEPRADTGAVIDASADAAASGTVSFSRDIYPLVEVGCALPACHDTATVTNHFSNLSSAASTYARWVNGPGFDFCADPPMGGGLYVERIIVVPGRPEQSYLVEKLSSTREDTCRSNHHPRMPPPPRPRWTAAQVAAVVSWIRQGALDN